MIAPRVLLTNRLVVPNDKKEVHRLRKKSLTQTGDTPSRPYYRTHTTPPPQVLSQTGRDREGRLAANNAINPNVSVLLTLIVCHGGMIRLANCTN